MSIIMSGDTTKLQVLDGIEDGQKVLRINLQITEKLTETKFRVSDEVEEAILTFATLPMAKAMKIGHYYLFRMLKRTGSRELHFENALFVETKPLRSASTSTSTAREEFLEIKSLVGVDSNKFFSQKLLGKILKMENKTTKSGKKLVEITISDLSHHTILSIWENQTIHLKNFHKDDIISLQNFMTSSYPYSDNLPKHLSWDEKRGTRVAKVLTPSILREFENLSVTAVENVLEGTVDMFSSLNFYKACIKCNKKVLDEEKSCRKGCYIPTGSPTFIDFSCFMAVNDGTDNWTQIKVFRNQIRDMESASINLSEDFAENHELVKDLFSNILEKSVRIKYKVARDAEGENKFISLELL